MSVPAGQITTKSTNYDPNFMYSPSAADAIPQPSMSGNGPIVMLMLVALFLVAFSRNITVPLFDAAVNGKALTISADTWALTMGGLVFIIIISILASTDAMGTEMLWMTIAIWIVFLVMNPDRVTSIVDSITKSSQSAGGF